MNDMVVDDPAVHAIYELLRRVFKAELALDRISDEWGDLPPAQRIKLGETWPGLAAALVAAEGQP